MSLPLMLPTSWPPLIFIGCTNFRSGTRWFCALPSRLAAAFFCQRISRNRENSTGFEVGRGAELSASLAPKKQVYLEGRISGKSKRQAALAAGFSESMASQPTDKIERKDVREAFATLIRETVSADEIAETLKAGMKAMDTKFFSEKGVVQDQRDVVAWSERRQYAQLAAEYGGYHAPDKGDREQGSGVILLLPGPPRPAPVIEATLVDAPAGGPMLILPDTPKGEADA
jgi:hypothetical protein